MADTSLKILQMVLNGQNSMKADMMCEFKKVREEIQDSEKRLGNRIDGVEINLTKLINRVDKLGLDLAKLSDDAPTIKEFDDLVSRVNNLQSKIALN
jgi:predicted nuclease with TOPRIM domain